MSGQIAALEEDKSQYQEQLDIVYSSLKDDPENAELHALKEELDMAIQMIDESIAELKPKKETSKPAAKKAPSPPPPQEKWSRENHPAFKKTAMQAEEKDKEQDQSAASYQVNDTVLAKWVSGDKGFYPARITSITGSSTAPVYTVKFKSYDTVETLRLRDIRPVAQKRKVDGTPVGSSVASSSTTQSTTSASSVGTSNNGVVTSAAASLYPQAQEGSADKNGSEEAPQKKFKKIKAKKELEAGKSKWQDFNAKSKFGKNNKKDSMFRTPDGVNARVGFTGSGQAMRKDPTRSRHIYQTNEDLD